MQALNMEDFCLDLDTVAASTLIGKVDELWREREMVERRIRSHIEHQERQSLKNSFLAYLLLKHQKQFPATPLREFVDQELTRGEW